MQSLERLIFVALLGAGSAGCSQGDPLVEDPSEEPPIDVGDDFFPLLDGATWQYRHIDASGVTERIESVLVEAASLSGRDTFLVTDPTAGPAQERTEQHFVREGSAVLRIQRTEYALGGEVDFTVDYDPGFPRYDSEWETGEGPFMFTYDRTESTAPTATEERLQIYTVVEREVEVTVAAGTFTCLQVERGRVADAPPDPDENAQRKYFWYAPGVGKVREEHLDGSTLGKVEELQSCSLPACEG